MVLLRQRMRGDDGEQVARRLVVALVEGRRGQLRGGRQRQARMLEVGLVDVAVRKYAPVPALEIAANVAGTAAPSRPPWSRTQASL